MADDEDHYLSSAPPNYSMSTRLFEHTNCKDEEILNPIDGVSNQIKENDLKYESSPYTCNLMKNIENIGNYSNNSSHEESCNSELDGNPMEDDNTSMQISHSDMHNDINNYDVENENINLIKQNEMKGSSSDNHFFLADEVLKVDENNSGGKNYESSSNHDIQEVNESLNENTLQHSKNINCEERKKKYVEVEKRKELKIIDELHYQKGSNSKFDEHNHRSHSDCKRSNFKDVNTTRETFNKIGNKFLRRRFEGFKDRRRVNHDPNMPFRVQEFKPQGFRKGFNHPRNPHHNVFLRRPNFNDRRNNMSHIRYRSEFHHFKNSRFKDHFHDRTKSFYRENSKDNYKNSSQQTPPSLHKEKPYLNHSSKRSKRSRSPLPNEDDIPSDKDDHPIDTKRSISPNTSESRHHRRFKSGSSGLGGYSPRRRRPEKTSSPPPRSPPDRKKIRAWDVAPPGIDSKVVAAIAAAHTAQQQVVSKTISTVSSSSPIISTMNIINPTHNLNITSNPTLSSSMMPSILQQVNQPLSTVTLTQATRSIRRLYVGNIPPTVSDGELMEFMNAAMLSANANHIPRTKPCINCMV